MHLNVSVCTLFAGFKPVKIQTRSNRTETDPAKNQTGIGSVSRWQKPDRTESFRGVILLLVENDLQRIRKKAIELDDVERKRRSSHKRHDEKASKVFENCLKKESK
jgi:hypothetical protein